MTKRKALLNFFIVSFNGMAIGLFSTLIIGVIIGQISKLFGYIPGTGSIETALLDLSSFIKPLMGIGIGFGIAIALKLDGIKLVVAGVAGGISTRLYNDPMVAYITTIGVYLFFYYVLKKKTPLDILLVPLTGALVAYIIAYFIGGPISDTMQAIGEFINYATALQPFFMGIIIAVIMGMALTAPISSAAIAIAISLGGIAGGAAVVGCSVQMLGFAVMSRKDNNIGTVLSIAIGTSMLQFKNILKKPIIWLPTIIVSAILGPLSTLVFKTETLSTGGGAGMGTSGLVGQISTLDAMGNNSTAWVAIILAEIILPMILVWIVDITFRKYHLIEAGDLKL